MWKIEPWAETTLESSLPSNHLAVGMSSIIVMTLMHGENLQKKQTNTKFLYCNLESKNLSMHLRHHLMNSCQSSSVTCLFAIVVYPHIDKPFDSETFREIPCLIFLWPRILSQVALSMIFNILASFASSQSFIISYFMPWARKLSCAVKHKAILMCLLVMQIIHDMNSSAWVGCVCLDTACYQVSNC